MPDDDGTVLLGLIAQKRLQLRERQKELRTLETAWHLLKYDVLPDALAEGEGEKGAA